MHLESLSWLSVQIVRLFLHMWEEWHGLMSFKANNYIVSLTTSECSFPQTLNKVHNKKFLIDAGKSLRCGSFCG